MMNISQLLFLLCSAVSVSSQAVNTTIYTDPTASTNTESVLLGGLFPITIRNSNGKCVGIKKLGIERIEGMVFAIRTINANSSILPQVNLTFDIRDTCSISNIALENSVNYVQNNDVFCSNTSGNTAVTGVLGPARSSISISTASFFRLFDIPQISYSSTAARLSDSTMFDYFFRTTPSDVLQAKAIADLIVNFNWTYIFALYSDDTYGEEGINSLIEELRARNDTNLCVALRAALPTTLTDSDIYDQIAFEMSREWISNASVAVLFGHLEAAEGIMNAIVRIGNSTSLHSMTWIASDSWTGILPKEYHTMARGMLGIQPHPGDVNNFRRYFDLLTPNTSRNPWFSEYWETVFKCRLSGSPPCYDGETRNLSHIETDAFVTNVIDAVYAFAHALNNMITNHCPDGTICDKIAITRSVGRAVNGTMLRDYLYNVSFPSTFTSGSDSLFDSNGDVQGSYFIQNLQFTSKDASSFVTVGTWDHINQLQLTRRIEWNGGDEEPPQSLCSVPCRVGYEPRRLADQEQCCWQCVPCLGESTISSGDRCYECADKTMPNSNKSGCIEIPITYFTWSSPWAISILCLTSIGIISAVSLGILFGAFYGEKVIKASSRELTAVILSGVLLCYILPFLFIIRPTPAVCGVRRFVIGFCFAITYSALLVRSNRIHRIFNQPVQKIAISPRFIGSVSQLVFTSILISIQVLIAVVWLAVEPPSVKLVQVDATTMELRCGESPYFGLSISLIYSLFLLLLSTYFAFLTRKVPDNFNEAKFINITLYSLCIIWVGFVPAYYVAIQFGTAYENFFLLLAIILSASTTLLVLLMPKIFLVFGQRGCRNKRAWSILQELLFQGWNAQLHNTKPRQNDG